MKNHIDYYSVGPLMYCPANHTTVGQKLVAGHFGTGFSMAFCLEDTIRDDLVEEAIAQLIQTFQYLYTEANKHSLLLPQLFIRVRDYRQIARLNQLLGETRCLVHGYIFPKFNTFNAMQYLDALAEINGGYKVFYGMPILESSQMFDLRTRAEQLYDIKALLQDSERHILNVRVGGNDMCHYYGFRRQVNESIYQLKPVAHLLSDIVTVFSNDYVLSGPVWEYYRGEGWEQGLAHELTDDRLCGFIGKTVIHPNQIEVVKQAFKVSASDYQDALSILNWNQEHPALVSGGASGTRMNEYKTHTNWAEKTMFLAKAYGINDAT